MAKDSDQLQAEGLFVCCLATCSLPKLPCPGVTIPKKLTTPSHFRCCPCSARRKYKWKARPKKCTFPHLVPFGCSTTHVRNLTSQILIQHSYFACSHVSITTGYTSRTEENRGGTFRTVWRAAPNANTYMHILSGFMLSEEAKYNHSISSQ